MIIAAGAGAFGPHRPPLANIADFEGKSVFYSIKNKKIFSDKVVVIAGGGDSAVDWAINLAEIATKIKLIHRRDKFRAAPESIKKLQQLQEQGKIELLTPYQLHQLHGADGQLTAVDIIDFDNQVKQISADFLLPFFGLSTSLGPIANWGLGLNKNHIEVNPTTMESSIPAIYAIGDIASYSNKLKLILSSFSEAAFACHSMYKIIFPDAIFHFEHSTNKGAELIKP
jgi:thioredoxin reductase (NADPH)